MSKTTTKELIKYAYNDANISESHQTQVAIDGDPLIAQDYAELLQTLALLDGFKQCPSQQTVDRILKFADQYKH
ncbi:MAG: hypothetical protein RIQ89_585 [Bacteroidota bacterium]|jgi:hypothetical protein